MPHKTSTHKTHISSRGKSKKQVSHEPAQWPILPHQLTALLSSHPHLMYKISSFGCIMKSWRSSPKECRKCRPPRLVEIDPQNHLDIARSHVLNISFYMDFWDCYYMRRWPYDQLKMYFRGCSHGYIVVMEEKMSSPHLWDPTRKLRIYLPPWNPNIPFKICVLSSFYEYPKVTNVMVITGLSSPAFAFNKCGKDTDHSWIVQNCTIEEPYAPGEYMKFTNAIGHNGKFYALSLQGSLAVIEEIDSCFVVTSIVGNRAVPCGASRRFREYLVELDGDVLLVLLLSRKSIDSVDDVEVYRLDGEGKLWERRKSIGEKALFVEDECCMGVDARKVGCKKNCVYFSCCKGTEWWVFEMDGGKILASFGSGTNMKEVVKWEEPDLERMNDQNC